MTRAPSTECTGGGTAGSRILVAMACVVVVLIGVHLLRDVLAPLAVAAVIVVICVPASTALTSRGWPRSVGTAAIVILAYSVLLVMIGLIWVAGAQFSQLLSDLSPGGDLAHVSSLVEVWSSAIPGVQIAEDGVSAPLSTELLTVVRSIGIEVLSIAAALFFVCAYVVVMAVDAGRYSRASALFGTRKGAAIARISRLNSSIRRYYVVNSAFGAVVAAIDGLALWWLGVPAPLLWAVLAFVTNVIPNIGFVIGLVPPALLALAIGGWPLLLAVVAVYCVVNVTLQVLIQPKFVSDAVGLSLTLSFFAVVFWTFVIGPVGALLAVPLTLAARSLLLEGDEDLVWMRWVSGDQSASTPNSAGAAGLGRPRIRRRRFDRDRG